MTANQENHQILSRDYKMSSGNNDINNYAAKMEQEILRYNQQENIHDLPGSFHYITNKYLCDIVKNITDFSFFKDFFANEIRQYALEAKEPVRVASIGSGYCDEELDLCQRIGLGDRVIFDCYELNQNLLDRGREKANSLGIKMNFFQQDFNQIKFATQYDCFFANHSLHHVVNLEGLFAAIHKAGKPGYFFLINDMIGRNGHMSWPRAQSFLECLWRTLPERLKWNVFFQRIDSELPNFDCSTEGFEGIRAQDILPLLSQNFQFEFFVPFFSLIQRIIDRVYGHNYRVDDLSSSNDLELLDYLWYMDELFLYLKYLPPTQMIAKVVDPNLEGIELKTRIYTSVEQACYWNFLDCSDVK